MADALFKIFINADIQRVWCELTKTGEAQGAVFNACVPTRPRPSAGPAVAR